MPIQWLDEADLSRIACGVSKDEVEAVVRKGEDQPVPAHLPKGRRYRIGTTSDGRKLRVEISQSKDGRNTTVQLVVIEPEKLLEK